MKTISKIAATAFVPLMAVTIMAASPADAQSRYRDYRDNGHNGRDDTGRNALLGAAIGGIAGCEIEGDATAGVGRCRRTKRCEAPDEHGNSHEFQYVARHSDLHPSAPCR